MDVECPAGPPTIDDLARLVIVANYTSNGDPARDIALAVLRALGPTLDPLLAACGRCGGGGLVFDGPVDYGLTGNASQACPACGPIRLLLAEADNGA